LNYLPKHPGTTAKALLEYLETVHVSSDRNYDDFRFPVQYVLRPDKDFRGFSGKLVSGIISPGETVMAFPPENNQK
jgi:sulfate adenylyltransferase subunit 1 (EFTu-like GTPase family)